MYTLSDDLALYARGFFNRYRGMAYPMTINKARQMSECGDMDGEPVEIPKTVRLACYALTRGREDYSGPED